MAKIRYFKKELVSQPFYAANGTPIPFKALDGETGLLKTDNEYLISQLEAAIRRRVGGVIEITAQQASELEKKMLSPAPKKRWSNQGVSAQEAQHLAWQPFGRRQAAQARPLPALAASRAGAVANDLPRKDVPRLAAPDPATFKPPVKPSKSVTRKASA